MHSRRGNAIASTLLLVTLAGFAALVVDVGYGRAVHYQLEAAADAASHAAVPFLDGTDAGLTAARASAESIALSNEANGEAVTLAPSDIVTGVWDGAAFTESTIAADVNAVQVTARAANLNTFFGRLAFSITSLDASAAAVAVRPEPTPPGAVECFLPLAVPACKLAEYAPGVLADMDFQFTSSTSDNAAWGSLFGHPSASDVRNLIRDCSVQGEAEIGDTVHVNNGQITSGLSELASAISGSSTRWDSTTLNTQPSRMSGSAISASNYGKTLEGSILVFDEQGQDCDAIQYNQSFPLVGFAWGVVYDVKTSGSSKIVKLRINNRVSMEYGSAGGGTVDAGVTYQPPPRVVY